ncbi:MAG TPA: IPT/TIG domain-containing protein [Thermoanaerobaculia bacterium]|nr:IPT/TIG domain-containing protein [Thermoanaerobaculia bacterium]
MLEKIRRATLWATAFLASTAALAGTQPPYRESVAEIMARQRSADRVQGPRLAPPRFVVRRRAPSSRPSSAPPRLASGGVAAPAPLASQSLGVSFLGADLADSNAIPPDTSGAVGPTQFLVGVNGRLRTFDKTTGVSDGALNAGTDVFFASVANSEPTYAPRIRFDRLSGRWFVTSLNFSPTLTDNRVLIAVSSGASITSGTIWTFWYFEHDLDTPAGDSNLYFDVGTLGVDANVLLVGGNLFDDTAAYQGTSVHAVRKSEVVTGPGGDLTASGSVVAYRNLTGTPTGTGPFAPQGADNPSDPAPTASWVIGVDNVLPVTSQLVLREITFSAPGAWPPSAISANTILPVPATALPLTVPHLGNAGGPDGELDALDDRLFDAKLRAGHLWTAHNIAVDATGAGSDSGDRDGARWYEIDLTGSPSVVQSGTLFDAAASNPRFYWIPSIMVSGQGHAAIGASAAGTAEHANAVTAGRLASDPAGTLQTPSLFTASAASYNPLADPGPPRRWGDYSFTSLDPNDDMTLWTIQEYCDATDSWGVRVAQLVAPPPAIPSQATPATISPGQASVSVVVTGTSVAGSGFFDPGAGYPNRLAALIPNGVTVNSATVTGPTSVTLDLDTVGAAPGPRTITITNPDGQSRTSSAAILTLATGGTPPEVDAIAPSSGDAATTTPIALTGAGFVPGATVTIAGVAATGVDVTGAGSANATTPVLAPGTLNDVTLVNPDTQSGSLYAAWFADFLDVPQADPFHADVEKIFRDRITAGCSGGNYCRNDAVSRAQMAVFLLKSKLGASHVPPACAGIFADVPCPSLFADWIEELYARGVTGGCNVGPLLYCPNQPVTRAQMATFLLKSSLGSSYRPPNCTGQVFTDVPCTGGIFDPWIEDLAARAITGGCGGGAYCPAAPNTRGQMAVFLVKTFSLP